MKRMAAKPHSLINRYAHIWWQSASMHLAVVAQSRVDVVTYILGKLIRMTFFIALVLGLFESVTDIVGYSKGQVLLFFAIMNCVDVIAQMVWFRGLYDLQRLVRTGDLDLILTKPLSPLFWNAFRMFDFFDLLTIPAAAFYVWFAVHHLSTPISLESVFIGLGLFILALVLAFSIALLIASLTFWTTELVNVWWLFRDLIYITRFPPEIFPMTLRLLLTFGIPIMVMVNFPTKGFLGGLTPGLLLWAVLASLGWCVLACGIWKFSLKHYTSAST